MTTYTPSYTSTGKPSIASRVRAELQRQADLFGAYPFSDRQLAADVDVPLRKVKFTINYLGAVLGEWKAHRGPIELRADPAEAGKELRRGTVLVARATDLSRS